MTDLESDIAAYRESLNDLPPLRSAAPLIAAYDRARSCINEHRGEQPSVLLMLYVTLQGLRTISGDLRSRTAKEGPHTLMGLPVESFDTMEALKAAYAREELKGGSPLFVDSDGSIGSV